VNLACGQRRTEKRACQQSRVPVKVKDALEPIEADDWQLARTRGSHCQYRHPD
jgi:hypothetical protein